MKKNLIWVSTAIVVCLIIVISLYFPPANADDSAGTIKKVNKYRNAEASENAIALRNDFLQDTTELKSAIVSLAFYERHLNLMTNEFSSWSDELSGITANKKELEPKISELNELSSFIKNNIPTISDTRELLFKFYLKDTADATIDINNKLINFGDFVNNLSKKDKVIDSLFLSVDGMLDKDKTELLADTKQQTKDLISLREKMLGAIVFHGFYCSKESTLNMVCKSKVIDANIVNSQLNIMFNAAYWSNTNKAVQGQEQLNMFMGKEALMGYAKQNLGAWHSSASLDGQVISAEQLSALKGAELGALLNLNKLGMFMGKDGLYGFIKSNDLGANSFSGQIKNTPLNSKLFNRDQLGPHMWAHSKGSLGPFFAVNNISAFRMSSQGLNSIGTFAKTMAGHKKLGIF